MKNKIIDRHIFKYIQELALDRHKMAFISGPRQTGKTTLAKSLLTEPDNYFNWDDSQFKKRWLKDQKKIGLDIKETQSQRVVFDEIHKNLKWKNQLKGFYDQFNDDLEIILTGSARLNIFRKGSDSLLGRFFHFHVMPFGISELVGLGKRIYSFDQLCQFLINPVQLDLNQKYDKITEQLFQLSGFPEPLFEQNINIHRIWQKNRIELLMRQDLKDISNVMNVGQVEILGSFIPDRVGSPLSVKSLSEDLDSSYSTIRRWLTHLENIYYHFEIKPFHKSIPRSLKKEGKIYMYDWTQVDSEGARFENMVAVHLLKLVHFYNDTGQANLELKYLRTKDKYEIDFIILNQRKPLVTIEVKLSETKLDPVYQKFQRYLNVPHFQIIKKSGYLRVYKNSVYKNSEFKNLEAPFAAVIGFADFFARCP